MDIDKLLADSSGDSEETVATKETVSSEETTVVPAGNDDKPVKKTKKKGKPRGGNNWLKPENIAPGLEAGDNTKFLSVNMVLMNMPDIDMENPLEVQQRLSDYFALYAQYDMKPTVVGMAIALNGHNRQWLYAVTHDIPGGGAGYKIALPPEVADVIKAYFLLENLWENYMQSGKVNPVAGIFLGKNNYGYQDKTEYVLTPNQQNDNDYSADEIRERYIASDQQKRLSASNSDEDTSD